MSTKHRQWAGALARDCGIPTMFQQTAQPPASNHAPATDEPRARRPYRKHREHGPEELAAIVADRRRGMSWADLRAKYDVANNVIQKALAAVPKKPVREAGESKHRYGIRVKAWMMQIDPEYRARVIANQTKASKVAWRRRKRALEKAAQPVAPEPTPAPPPAVIESPQPVAMIVPRPAVIAAPRVGFWRALGMMLGVVR